MAINGFFCNTKINVYKCFPDRGKLFVLIHQLFRLVACKRCTKDHTSEIMHKMCKVLFTIRIAKETKYVLKLGDIDLVIYSFIPHNLIHSLDDIYGNTQRIELATHRLWTSYLFNTIITPCPSLLESSSYYSCLYRNVKLIYLKARSLKTIYSTFFSI